MTIFYGSIIETEDMFYKVLGYKLFYYTVPGNITAIYHTFFLLHMSNYS